MKEANIIFKRVGTAMAVGTLLVFIGQVVGGAILQMNPSLSGNSGIALAISMLPVLVLGYPVMTLMLRKLPATQAEKKQIGIKDFISCICLTFTVMYVFNYLGMGIVSVLRMLMGKQAANPLAEVVLGTDYLSLFFFMVIAAPIAEELFFRKVLIDKTLACGKKTAILASAVIFGLFHGNFQQTLYTFFMGLFFAFLYVKTGNVIYPIILHMIINFFGSFLAKYIVDGMPSEILEASETETAALMSSQPEDFTILLVFTGVILIAMIMGAFIYIKNKEKFKIEEEEGEIEKGKRLKTILFNPGMILFTIYYGFSIVLLLVA